MRINVNMIFCELSENRYTSTLPFTYEGPNEERGQLVSGQSCRLVEQILKTNNFGYEVNA